MAPLQGRAHKQYMDSAFPGTGPYDRLQGSTGAKGVDPGVQIAKIQANASRYQADKAAEAPLMLAAANVPHIEAKTVRDQAVADLISFGREKIAQVPEALRTAGGLYGDLKSLIPSFLRRAPRTTNQNITPSETPRSRRRGARHNMDPRLGPGLDQEGIESPYVPDLNLPSIEDVPFLD